MDPCRETALAVAVWHAFLTVLIAGLGIALFDLDGRTALLVLANIALLFAVVLMARTSRLTEVNIDRSHVWRLLARRDRGHGAAGARMAHRAVHETWLRFAQGAAAVAIVLAVFAYTSETPLPGPLAGALRTSAAHAAPGDYFARVPTN